MKTNRPFTALCHATLAVALLLSASQAEDDDIVADIMQRAEMGDAEAQLVLGNMYARGDKVPKDDQLAQQWLEKAAEGGNRLAVIFWKLRQDESLDATELGDLARLTESENNADTQLYLGSLFFNGKKVPQDLKSAIYWLEKAAANGNHEAQVGLALARGNSEFEWYNPKEALFWLQQAAEAKYPKAMLILGSSLLNGSNLVKRRNSKEGYRLIRLAAEAGYEEAQHALQEICNSVKHEIMPKAEAGNAEAQFFIGECYMYGIVLPLDKQKAMEWYEKAAEQDHILGIICVVSQLEDTCADAPEKHPHYLSLIKRGAELGDVQMQAKYSVILSNEGTPLTNYEEAARWMQKAAEQGYAMAQCDIGTMYLHGRGVPTDIEKAMVWYTAAAEQGEMHAQLKLGAHYLSGVGVPKDTEQAISWLEKASAQGSPDAAYLLGLLYLGTTPDVPKDDAKAQEQLRHAVIYGNEEAQKLLQEYFPFIPLSKKDFLP